jgi:hypothetical protein
MGVSGQRHAPAALYPRGRTPGDRPDDGEAVRTSETSANIYLTARQYIPEDCDADKGADSFSTARLCAGSDS